MPDAMRPLGDFLKTAEPPELGPGPRPGVRSAAQLQAELDRCFAAGAGSAEQRQLIRALILLWHDHLEPAHRLAQDVAGPDGAFVHGIMHRREPDYANAAYWFRRVGRHPCYAEIAGRARGLPIPPVANRHFQWRPDGDWDPFAFINAVEQAQRDSGAEPERAWLRQLQKIESEALLEYLAGSGM